nr:hypothetical protein [uncultured Sphingomonas sp.]
MARFDGKLEAAGDACLDLSELMTAFSSVASAGVRDRHAAMACFLSASEGWRDAKGTLKGTFADLSSGRWLTSGKE